METDYLKRCFGNCLAQALAEVAELRPSDPIEYLAHWLYHYRQITKAEEEPPRAVASSTKTKFKQEKTKLLEKEASEQECLPDTSIVIPGMPQQTPSADPPDQMDRNAGTSQEINC